MGHGKHCGHHIVSGAVQVLQRSLGGGSRAACPGRARKGRAAAAAGGAHRCLALAGGAQGVRVARSCCSLPMLFGAHLLLPATSVPWGAKGQRLPSTLPGGCASPQQNKPGLGVSRRTRALCRGSRPTPTNPHQPVEKKFWIKKITGWFQSLGHLQGSRGTRGVHLVYPSWGLIPNRSIPKCFSHQESDILLNGRVCRRCGLPHLLLPAPGACSLFALGRRCRRSGGSWLPCLSFTCQ